MTLQYPVYLSFSKLVIFQISKSFISISCGDESQGKLMHLNRILGKSQPRIFIHNHSPSLSLKVNLRMDWAGRDHFRSSSPPLLPCAEEHLSQIRLLRALSNLTLNISRYGAATASLAISACVLPSSLCKTST